MALEVCVDNIVSVRNAFKGGADRLELCSALSEGGLTPTVGLLRQARQVVPPTFPIYAMIRPRGGNFVYDEDELCIMEHDVKVLKESGASGFVFGALTENNAVHTANCQRLLTAVSPLPVTFHRAFDEVVSPFEALEAIIQLGFERLLTSGQAETAEAGKEVICRLVAQSNGRIIVMPGSGVAPHNLNTLMASTQSQEFHGSAKGINSGYSFAVTSEDVVRQLKQILATNKLS